MHHLLRLALFASISTIGAGAYWVVGPGSAIPSASAAGELPHDLIQKRSRDATDTGSAVERAESSDRLPVRPTLTERSGVQRRLRELIKAGGRDLPSLESPYDIGIVDTPHNPSAYNPMRESDEPPNVPPQIILK